MKVAAVPFWLVLTGCSDYGFDVPERVTDRYVVEGNVDIVVFGDTSESMRDTLDTLTGNFVRFVSRLEEAESRWQVAAVTGPDGCAQGGVLTPETPDWEDTFTVGINTPPGEDQVDEWGLNNVAAAIDASAEGGCNEGLIREDAALHLIFVSDEDDNSPGWDGPDPEYWRAYLERYFAAKGGDASRVHLTAVGGPEPIGCSYADFSRGYWDAVLATEGDFLSICDDWVFDLEALADTSVRKDRFALGEEARPDSVQVFVDLLERVGGWAYDEERAEVVFTDQAPYLGQAVDIRYETIP